MNENTMLAIAVFGLVSSGIALVAVLLISRRSRTEARVADYSRPEAAASAETGDSTLSRLGISRLGGLIMPRDESRLGKMKKRLLQAGFYQRYATVIYTSIKFILMIAPMAVGLALYWSGMLPLAKAVFFGAAVGLIGTLAPSLWLGSLSANRQRNIRRALPDALDVIVVCLEGGLSLPASFARVANELHSAHPLLAMEMAIVRKEMELGRSTGEALRQLANRFDVDELRSMASVVSQAERFGASLVKAFRVHADALRLKRHQHAEAMAQKAPLKLIFPTVLCIFPALYVILMGPAAVHVYSVLQYLRQ